MNNVDPLIGQSLDNYLVQQLLGHGGMARVYKGLDTSLKRPVAIKVIEEHFRATGAYRLRFEHEAQAVANLHHPNIVTVYHFGKQAGLYYLVMEYINGADLDTIIRNYGTNGELMPHNDVLRIIGEMASALDYAHAQGVIHRDIKPSNIMLERNGRSILTDFGLALRVSEGTVGEAFGSPHYISPEQARNSASVVPQSDLYSLGVVVYELLTGTVPFDDPSPTTLAVQHIVAPLPSARAFNRNLSDTVDHVLHHMLAKNPNDRYQSGQEFMAALHSALESIQTFRAAVVNAELPPLPPGVEPPPPRRLSMQTALDKVGQHMMLEQAKGKSLTQTQAAPFTEYPPVTAPIATTRMNKSRLPSLVLSGLGALSIVIVGFVIFLFLSNRAEETNLVTRATNTVLAGSQEVIATQTAIPVVGSVVMNTSTSELSATLSPLPTQTVFIQPTVPPSTATFPPSHTPPSIITEAVVLLPTATAMPTEISLPPTLEPMITVTLQATILYPDGLPFTLVYDTDAIFLANKSDQRISLSKLTFEQVLTSGQIGNRYEGGRWSQFYAWNEPKFCVVAYISGKNPSPPIGECPRGFNSTVAIQGGEYFWSTSDTAQEFRILWNGQEIARCAIVDGRCELRLPRAP